MEDLRVYAVLAGWMIGWWLLWRVRRLTAPDLSGASAGDDLRSLVARCTVVIPARDEAGSIGCLLESLGRQTMRPGRIIVVDDQSTDDTAALARDYDGVTVLAGEPLPAGWIGKSWACHQATTIAPGGLFVFLDADVVLEPGALAALVAEHARAGGLLSVQPYHRAERTYERLSALFNIIGFMGIGAASPGRDGRSRGAFGPCLVTDGTAYEHIGGHGAVHGEIVEDIALARAYEQAGEPVRTLGGGTLLSFRMYPGGVGSLIEGWSKNMAVGAGSTRPARLALIGFWVTCCLLTVQFMIEEVFGRIDVGRPTIVLLAALFEVQWATMLRQLGNFGWRTALLYPLPLGVFVVVFARSAYLTLVRRRVQWRGRTVPVSRWP